MKPQHAFRFGNIRELDQASFRAVSYPAEPPLQAVDFLSFPTVLRGVTMYCRGRIGIAGITMHAEESASHIGQTTSEPRFFPISGPAETIAKIEIRKHTRRLIRTITACAKTETHLLRANYTPDRHHLGKIVYIRKRGRRPVGSGHLQTTARALFGRIFCAHDFSDSSSWCRREKERSQ